MMLREMFDKVIATRRPDVIEVNRKMFKTFLFEMTKEEGSFKNLRIKYKNVAIHSNPGVPNGEIRSSKNPRIIL